MLGRLILALFLSLPCFQTLFMWAGHHYSAVESQCLIAFECLSKTRKAGRLFAFWTSDPKSTSPLLRPFHSDDLIHTPKINGG